jgi:hypothetical protein
MQRWTENSEKWKQAFLGSGGCDTGARGTAGFLAE